MNVVIVGAGFGGLKAALRLTHSSARVTLLDKQNHHLFQPLLYQVATAGLSPAEIAVPIRQIVRGRRNVEVFLSELTGVDPEKKVVQTTKGEVSYDKLIIATGSRYNYFGNDSWKNHALSLKTIADATSIRQRILTAFERAEMEEDLEKRRALLTFVLVGGGPTGAEMAGAMAELAQKALAADFRRINPRSARFVLVEAGPRILSSFSEDLSETAKRDLESLGIEVLCQSTVESIDDKGVTVAGSRIDAATVVWCAGILATPVGEWLGVETDRIGRIPVDENLAVPGHPDIFVIGDAAHVKGENGHPLPGVAPVAMQQGDYVAGHLMHQMDGLKSASFKYKDKGNLATMGRAAAIAEIGKLKLSGRIGWWVWVIVHIYYLIGFKNRLFVMAQWAWSYLTFQRGARLITTTKEPILE